MTPADRGSAEFRGGGVARTSQVCAYGGLTTWWPA